MKRLINNIVLLLLLMFGFSASYAQAKKDIQAKIKIVQSDNIVSVYATATNNTNTFHSELNYSLLSLKEDATGNMSKKTQFGAFSLTPNESKTLSTQNLNIDSKGKLKVFLFIRKNGQVLSKDTMNIGSIEKKFINTPLNETQIEISGLIIENVLTKPGKDFYEFFTQINRTNNINYPFVIVINEKPRIGGRNSEISIFIKEDIVFKFVTQPKEEYLQMAARVANKAIYDYNIKRKELYKNEKLY